MFVFQNMFMMPRSERGFSSGRGNESEEPVNATYLGQFWSASIKPYDTVVTDFETVL